MIGERHRRDGASEKIPGRIPGSAGDTPPPVFFVRVANKGVSFDAARKSGK